MQFLLTNFCHRPTSATDDMLIVGAINLYYRRNIKHTKNLLHRNMTVQQELQWLLQRNGPMGKKSLLNPMIAVIRLFFTNFQG